MTAILHGVRILEVAEHTFVPAASAALADLGADVIKIEHVERGDAMRGLASSGVISIGGGVHALLEHSNRGKRSIGVDLTQPDGVELIYKLAATCDVFLTNKLPSVREKLNIGIEQIRKANPNIIYVRGTGQGERGPDADKGSYDSLAFWARAGAALGSTRPEYGSLTANPPGPGFGDSIGGMTIAGAIMGALFHRERTDEATEVDVSLFGTGLWAMGQAVAMSLVAGEAFRMPRQDQMNRNPLVNVYETKDGRFISLTCLQAGKYWRPMCEVIGNEALISDPRFESHLGLLEHGAEAVAILQDAFKQATLEEWRDKLAHFTGQWAVLQDAMEAASDPQAVANGYMQPVATAEGSEFRLVAVPMQFNNAPAPTNRAPEFNEHGDEILGELGLDFDAIIDLRVRGVVA
ncbi:MAG: CoA transferase [Acidimicrobiales bacterium]|nr:CoA transferase [Acidimicrobiales bacterium]